MHYFCFSHFNFCVLKEMKMLVLMLMLLTFTPSLTAARRDPSPPLFYDSVIDKTWPLTPLAFTHSLAVTRSDLPSPLFPDGITNNTPPPPSLLPLQPPSSHPSNIEVNINVNLTLKIALSVAAILSIIGWISYKYCNTKPTMHGSDGVEAEIEIQPIS
jgi:hypothetical protein